MRYLMVKIILCFTAIGCAAPYVQYYVDNIKGFDTSNIIFSTEEPKIYYGTNIDDDIIKLVEDNYILLGYSSFIGPKFDVNQAIEQGKKVKASVVVVYSKYLDTISGIRPLFLPDIKTSFSSGQATALGSAYGTGGYASGVATAYGMGTTTTYGTKTIYVPYSIDRFIQGATYWAKEKRVVFGAWARDLPSELRQKMGTNKGVLVIAVRKQSPAFLSDIIRGDIIKKINDIEIIDNKHYVQTIFQNANKKVTITLVRNGKEIVKEVQLAPAPEGAEINLQKFLSK